MIHTGKIFLTWSVGLSLFVFIGMGNFSCRSAKKITTAINKKDTVQTKTDTVKAVEDLHADSLKYIQQLYSHIQSGIIDCRTFSAKLKVHYESSDGKDYEFNALLI